MRVSEDYWDELCRPNVKIIPTRKHVRRRLHVAYFPFVRKRSLPFLTVDATSSNQAFSHDRWQYISWIKLQRGKKYFFE